MNRSARRRACDVLLQPGSRSGDLLSDPRFVLISRFLPSAQETLRTHADGIPLPPPQLRVLVAGTADVDWFLRSGQAQTTYLRRCWLSWATGRRR